jgi:mRNA interferase MazF
VIVVPVTTKGRDYPTRVHCLFEGKLGQIILAAIRKHWLVKKLGNKKEKYRMLIYII